MVELIRLVTGEELIAKVRSENDNAVEIENPIVIAVQKQEDGNMGANFIPWIQFGDVHDTTVELNKSSIMYRVTPVKQFVDNYNQMFGHIVTPNQNITKPQLIV